MADGIVPADEIERTAHTVVAEAERLDRLVSDLLDLARLGAVDFRVNPVETDLDELVADAALVWTDRAARHDVELRVERPQVPVLITTDPMRARQILDNLAENALRVSPAGSVIVLATRADEGGAILEVRDSGPGLTDDDVAVAFEPGVLHERYRGVRPVGTGLGLALVGKLAGGLGGSAEAGTAAEGGARFTVRLPVAT
jgi:two-component system sensor histidine kinase BaeS